MTATFSGLLLQGVELQASGEGGGGGAGGGGGGGGAATSQESLPPQIRYMINIQ